MEGKIIAVVLFTLVLVGIGWWSSRRTKNVGDFFLAGRTLGPWVSALAFGTTYFSAVLFVGYAGKLGWGFGLHALWIALGNAVVGALLAWMVLARRTRQMTARLDTITMPEFLAARYGAGWLKPVAALVIFVFLVPYSASVYTGLGYLFEATLGIPFLWAQVFMAALTGAYLLMGGYLAVTLTDFAQALVQFVGVVLMIWLLSAPFGGPLASIFQLSGGANAPALHAPPAMGMFPGWMTLASLVLITSLGVWGLPHMVQRFYSIKSVDMIKRATLISTVFALVIAGTAYYVGSLSHLYFTAETLPSEGGKIVFDRIVPMMIHLNTPAWFATMVLLVVLAASMTTLASLVLVSSAAVSVDMLGLRTRGEETDRRGVAALRMLCAVFVALSVVLAGVKWTFIVNLMVISWASLAGFFLAPYVYGLFWKRANLPGAVAAMAAGLTTMVGLFILWYAPEQGHPGIPIAGALAMLLPLVVLPLVTVVTSPPPPEQVRAAFEEAEEEPEVEAAPVERG